MSYDVSVNCPCGNQTWDGNCTSNLSAMWTKAGAPLRDWNNAEVNDILPKLQRAIEYMESDPYDFKPLEPDNGWGDLPGCIDFLKRFRDACVKSLGGKVTVSH